jgi:para-aminobenzoate synthetase/4-amino-4-deoxychorismate lyase
LRLGPKPIPRPDPAAGVFETIRARDGVAVRLEEHLARLARSVRELYGAEVGGEAAALAEAAAAEVGDGRVRLDARPLRGERRDGGGAVALGVQSGPLADEGPVELRPVCVPGGLGAHKWADRRLLDALGEAVRSEGRDGARGAPLLTDVDGIVLEAATANVVIVEDGRLVTPPADGRILPGVGRGALGAVEEEIDLDRLERADAVLLVSALRGPRVVRGDAPAALAV